MGLAPLRLAQLFGLGASTAQSGINDLMNLWGMQRHNQSQGDAIQQVRDESVRHAGVVGEQANTARNLQQRTRSAYHQNMQGELDAWKNKLNSGDTVGARNERLATAGRDRIQGTLNLNRDQIDAQYNQSQAGLDDERRLAQSRYDNTLSTIQSTIQEQDLRYGTQLDEWRTSLEEAKSDASKLRDKLQWEVGSQVASSLTADKAAEAQALAEFESKWTGARDNRYFAAKNSLQRMMSSERNLKATSMLETAQRLSAEQGVALQSSTNNLRAAMASAQGQAFSAWSDGRSKALAAIGDNNSTLSKTVGDVMSNKSSNYQAWSQNVADLSLAYTNADQWATENIMAGWRENDIEVAALRDVTMNYLSNEATWEAALNADYLAGMAGVETALSMGNLTAANMEYGRTWTIAELSSGAQFFNAASGVQNQWWQQQEQENQRHFQERATVANALTLGLAGGLTSGLDYAGQIGSANIMANAYRSRQMTAPMPRV